MCLCVCTWQSIPPVSVSVLLWTAAFLKGLSGGSGVIVLGQVNWPRLAAKLSKNRCCVVQLLEHSGPFYLCLKSLHFGRDCKIASVLSIYGSR